jgi:hypothetical protein
VWLRGIFEETQYEIALTAELQAGFHGDGRLRGSRLPDSFMTTIRRRE